MPAHPQPHPQSLQETCSNGDHGLLAISLYLWCLKMKYQACRQPQEPLCTLWFPCLTVIRQAISLLSQATWKFRHHQLRSMGTVHKLSILSKEPYRCKKVRKQWVEVLLQVLLCLQHGPHSLSSVFHHVLEYGNSFPSSSHLTGVVFLPGPSASLIPTEVLPVHNSTILLIATT